MPTYYDAACLAFGSKEFSVEEFRTRLGTNRAPKLLSEMKARGVVERAGAGRYRVLGPEERPDLRSTEWARVREILLSAPLAKAWSGPSAVEKWTRGRYKVSTNAFAREFHLAVPNASLIAWRIFLAREHISLNPRRSIGPRVILEPREKLRATTLDGEPVVPRSEVVALIRSNPAFYAGAEALLAS